MQSAEEFLRALDPVERGRVISVLRSARGKTRDELARDAKVSPNTISDWERGNVRNPRDLYVKLAGVLGLSLPNIQHALSLVRAQQDAGEIAEPPAAAYDSTALDGIGLPSNQDIKGMTPSEIEQEIAHLT
ncbi:MAG TPA: helix-turn-helix transcriptional regulator, partial [Thermoanaerobaculia bacterium]